MKATSKIVDVEAELRAREAYISGRLDAIQDEVATTGEAVKQAVLSHPLVGVGLTVAAGLLVGLILGKSGKKAPSRRAAGRRSSQSRTAKVLSESIIDRVVERTASSVESGNDPRRALRSALRKEAKPLVDPREQVVVKNVEEEAATVVGAGFVGGLLSFAVRLVAQAILRDRIDGVMSRYMGRDEAAAAASDPLASNPLASDPLASDPLASNPLASDPLASNPIL